MQATLVRWVKRGGRVYWVNMLLFTSAVVLELFFCFTVRIRISDFAIVSAKQKKLDAKVAHNL